VTATDAPSPIVQHSAATDRTELHNPKLLDPGMDLTLRPMRYPELARQARLQGSISIRLTISSAGTVVDAMLLAIISSPALSVYLVLRSTKASFS